MEVDEFPGAILLMKNAGVAHWEGRAIGQLDLDLVRHI